MYACLSNLRLLHGQICTVMVFYKKQEKKIRKKKRINKCAVEESNPQSLSRCKGSNAGMKATLMPLGQETDVLPLN